MQEKLLFSILKDKVSTCLFCVFFDNCRCFCEGLGISFAVLLEPLSSLWRAGVMLLGAFGLLGLSVGSLCYFSWSLWLVWAVCGLSLLMFVVGISRIVFGQLLSKFSHYLGAGVACCVFFFKIL